MIKAMPFDYDSNNPNASTLFDYSAELEREFLKYEISNGIYPSNIAGNGTSFYVTKTGAMQITISSGAAVIEGLRIINDENIVIDFTANAQKRAIDIVLEADFANQSVSIAQRARTSYTASARCANMVRNVNKYQICLATVNIEANASVISSVEDTRLCTDICTDGKPLCGIISCIYQTDTAALLTLMRQYVSSNLISNAITKQNLSSDLQSVIESVDRTRFDVIDGNSIFTIGSEGAACKINATTGKITLIMELGGENYELSEIPVILPEILDVTSSVLRLTQGQNNIMIDTTNHTMTISTPTKQETYALTPAPSVG